MRKSSVYLWGGHVITPPNNASPCFPSTAASSEIRSRYPCDRPSGINLLVFFSIIYLYPFQIAFVFLPWTTTWCKIIVRKMFFCNPPPPFICRPCRKRMVMLMKRVKHLLHQGRRGHLYVSRRTWFFWEAILSISSYSLLPYLGILIVMAVVVTT